MKAAYEKAGPEPSNMRYGYVVPNGAWITAVCVGPCSSFRGQTRQRRTRNDFVTSP